MSNLLYKSVPFCADSLIFLTLLLSYILVISLPKDSSIISKSNCKAQLINNILNRDPHYAEFEHDVRYLLNLHEKMAIDYYALQLDLDIIDESLGNEITKIYDNNRVKKIRESAQNGTDLYNKLDIFQKELKLIRNDKIRKKKK